jgi:poly(3-hydroxybutyrate) depolymerase
MRVILTMLAVAAALAGAGAQERPGRTFDHVVPPGANYDKAEFRLWLPADAGRVAAVVVLVPGSNGDGRPMAEDAFWQAFATRHQLALVGTRFTDRRHEQSFIEDYVDVAKGSGQALVDALASLGAASGHSELGNAPLFLWGMSAGGQFNYEFAAWKPDRVAAFVVNKGGIYYTALASREAREVPALLFTGETDLVSRVQTITGLFAVNRRGGALWALTQEPGVGHAVARSQEFGALFFEELLPIRIGAPGAPLSSLAGRPGFIGDLTTHTYEPAEGSGTPGTPNVWLPTERIAKAWVAVVTGQPIER